MRGDIAIWKRTTNNTLFALTRISSENMRYDVRLLNRSTLYPSHHTILLNIGDDDDDDNIGAPKFLYPKHLSIASSTYLSTDCFSNILPMYEFIYTTQI